MRKLCLFLIPLALLLTGAAQRPVVRLEWLNHPEKLLSTYKVDMAAPVAARVQTVPEVFLRYLRIMDKNPTYVSYAATSEDLALMKEYLAKLPPAEQQVMQDHLVAIFFVKNFMGSGWTDFVLDPKNPEKLYLVLALNPDVLHTDVSTWVTKKENSCFAQDDPDSRIEIDCGKEYKGLMYILLHESAHMVDYIRHATPYVTGELRELYTLPDEPAPFTKGIWADYYTPVPADNYPLRTQITFYGLSGGPKLKIGEALGMYNRLQETPFASLYGSTNWAEDFADFCAYYYFTQKLGQPYTLTYYRSNAPVFKFSPMTDAKAKERFPLIQQILESAPAAK